MKNLVEETILEYPEQPETKHPPWHSGETPYFPYWSYAMEFRFVTVVQ